MKFEFPYFKDGSYDLAFLLPVLYVDHANHIETAPSLAVKDDKLVCQGEHGILRPFNFLEVTSAAQATLKAMPYAWCKINQLSRPGLSVMYTREKDLLHFKMVVDNRGGKSIQASVIAYDEDIGSMFYEL